MFKRKQNSLPKLAKFSQVFGANRQRHIQINQSKARALFLQRPVWQALLMMSIPGVIVVLLQGIFIFASQILTVDLIPLDGVHSNESIWGPLYPTIVHQLIPLYDAQHHVTLPVYNIQDVVKSANSFSTPLLAVVLATVMWITQGAMILYSRALGKRLYERATGIYYQELLMTAVVCLLMMALMYGCSHIWIEQEANAPKSYHNLSSTLAQYYHIYSTVSIQWAQNYVYIFLASSYIQGVVWIYTYNFISEGKNLVVTLFTLASEIVGIIIAFVLIYYAKLQLMGPGIAAIILYIVNLGMLLVYVGREEHAGRTCMSISWRTKMVWNWEDAKMEFLLGTGTFFQNLSMSFITSFSLESLNQVNALVNGESQAMFYSAVYGIVLPIFSLTAGSQAGIFRASKSILSYVYSVEDFQRVHEVFWMINIYSTLYNALLFVLIVYLLGGYGMPGDWGQYAPIIGIFHLNGPMNEHQYHQVQVVLMIFMIQILAYGPGNQGRVMFQATKRPYINILTSLFPGVLVLIPMLFILKAISLHEHSIEPILWLPAIDGIIASLLSGLLGYIYMYTTFRKIEQRARQALWDSTFHQAYKLARANLDTLSAPKLTQISEQWNNLSGE